ncbi:MAG: caspase family protein [Bacteroidota bacterium]
MRLQLLSFLAFLLLLNGSLFSQVDLIIPLGHTDRITSISASSDGKYIASAGVDYKVKIWDVATGRELVTFYEHNRPVNAVTFTPDGTKLISADDDGMMYFRDVASYKMLKKVSLGSEIFCMNVSPDGKLLAVGMWKIIHIFDMATMTEVRSIAAYAGPDLVSDLLCVDFAADGKTLLSAGKNDRKIKIWNALTGSLTKTINAVADNVSADISSDGLTVIAAGGSDEDSVYKYNVTSGALIYAVQGSKRKLRKICFSPDNSQFVTADENWEAKLWDAGTGAELKVFSGHNDDVSDICFGRTPNLIFTASEDQSIWLWDTGTAEVVKKFKAHSRNIHTVDFAPDSRRIAIGCGSPQSRFGNHLIVWDLAGTSGIKSFLPNDDVPGDVNAARFSPSGLTIASAAESDNEKLRFWDVATGTCTQFIKKAHSRDINSLCWSADGKFVYTAGDDAEAYKWDAVNGAKLAQYSGGKDDIMEVAASADGKYLAAAGDDRKVFLWNTVNGNLVKSMVHDDDLSTCAFSHDGTKVLSGSRFGILKLWSAPSGNLITTLNAGSRAHSVFSACFSMDDKKVFSGGWDNNIRVWDIATATTKFTIKGHDMMVSGVSASPDGKLLVSGSADNTVKLWNLKDYSQIANLVILDSVDWVVSTPDNYYFCSKGALSIMGFRKGNEVFPFEQFDLQYNRPDIVLDRIGYASPELINSLKKAYHKRLRKMKFDESMFSPDFHMPNLVINKKEKIPLTTTERSLSIDFAASDSKYKLDRINVWINDVPVYGINGIDLRNENSASTEKKLTLQLSQGRNNIQVSCLNEKGIESLRQTFEINYQPAQPVTPNLYVIAISVSDYKDDRFNLKYAAKDGRDLAGLFTDETENNGKVFIDTLFNKNATRDNIIALRQKLMKTTVDDRVILYVSGHGLLDDSLDFYFATYDMNFSKPAQSGILYDDLEGLLDGIPAREKLLLMDACHSGEVDKEDVFEIKDTNLVLADGAKGDLKTYGYKGIKIEKQNNGLGLQNSFELMQELFANLSRGSGAVVISAAAGTGYALESAEWNNGVFTYCILDGIKNKSADRDGNGSVTVGELKDYVSAQVEKLTRGAQKPTSRRESLGFDWKIR